MPGRDDWLDVARSASTEDLREHILTGFKSGKPFTPYVPTIALPSQIDWVLDFGCGVGRNFSCVRTLGRHVAAFDLPPMVARCRELRKPLTSVGRLAGSEGAPLRPDLCVAGPPAHRGGGGARVPADFATMAPASYLLTRSNSDFNVNVLTRGRARCLRRGRMHRGRSRSRNTPTARPWPDDLWRGSPFIGSSALRGPSNVSVG